MTSRRTQFKKYIFTLFLRQPRKANSRRKFSWLALAPKSRHRLYGDYQPYVLKNALFLKKEKMKYLHESKA